MSPQLQRPPPHAPVEVGNIVKRASFLNSSLDLKMLSPPAGGLVRQGPAGGLFGEGLPDSGRRDGFPASRLASCGGINPRPGPWPAPSRRSKTFWMCDGTNPHRVRRTGVLILILILN